jgi:hypothetical protein
MLAGKTDEGSFKYDSLKRNGGRIVVMKITVRRAAYISSEIKP